MAINSETEMVLDLKALVLELEAYRGEDIIDRVHDFMGRLLTLVSGRVLTGRGRQSIPAEMLEFIQQHALPNPKINQFLGGPIGAATNPYWENKRKVLAGQLSDEEKQKLMQAVPQAVIHTQPAQKTVRLESTFSVPLEYKKTADEKAIVEALTRDAVQALAKKLLHDGLIRPAKLAESDTNRMVDQYRIGIEVVVP